MTALGDAHKLVTAAYDGFSHFKPSHRSLTDCHIFSSMLDQNRGKLYRRFKWKKNLKIGL